MKKLLLLLLAVFTGTSVFAQWSLTGCYDIDPITGLGTKGDTVLAATAERFYLSADQGETWNDLWNGLPYFGHCSAILTDGSTLYVGTDDGVYVSHNNGDTFVLQNNGYAGATIKCLLKNGNTILAGTYNYGFTSGVLFQSQNQGQTWQCISNSMNPNVHKVNCIALNGSTILTGTNYNLFASNNNGVTWTPKSTGMGLIEVTALAITGNHLYCGTTNGIFLSDNAGESWSLCTNGLTGNEWISSLKVINGHVFAGCSNGGGVMLLRSFESEWVNISAGLNSMQILNLSANDQYIFAGTYAIPGFNTGGVFRQELAALVGINEYGSSTNSIQVIPNPMNNTITIQLPNDFQNSIFSMYNTAGQVVIQSEIQNRNTILNVSGLQKGIFYWELNTQKYIEKGKVVIW